MQKFFEKFFMHFYFFIEKNIFVIKFLVGELLFMFSS